MNTVPYFFGETEHPLFGVYHSPSPDTDKRQGIVLCSPIAREYIRSHRMMQQVAFFLCRKSGYHVLKFDYSGCGDSWGTPNETSVHQWLKDIQTASAELRDMAQITQVSLLGLRLGGALANMAGIESGDFDRLVLWDPVLQGSDYIAKLRSMHNSMLNDPYRFPEPRQQSSGGEREELFGFQFSDKLQKEIEDISLPSISNKLNRQLTVISSDDSPEIVDFCSSLEAQDIELVYHYSAENMQWDNWVNDEIITLAGTQNLICSLFP